MLKVTLCTEAGILVFDVGGNVESDTLHRGRDSGL